MIAEAADLPHIRADRARCETERQTRRYRQDEGYRCGLEAWDWILARRERELAAQSEEAR